MKRAFNRAIAMLLVLFIVFPMLPVSVLAEQSTTLQGVGSVHTVTFESDQPASYLVADGKSIETMPEAPEKTAADFIGWYDGETEITAPFTPQADMTIVPKYDAWDARTLDAQVDGATVTLSGVMPSDVSLTVTDHLAEQPVQLLKIAPKKSAGTAAAPLSVDEKVSLYSLDIGMQKNDATEYQPDAETPVRVTIAGEKIATAVSEGRALNVTHTLDDGTAEQIADLTVQGETVSFSVTHFSTFDVDAVWNMTSVDTELMDGVSLSGTMPSGVRANAAPAEVEDALMAAELSFTNYDHDVQPAAWGGSMTVTMHSDAIAQAVQSGAEMKALRVSGDAAEELDIAVHEDGSVSFAADAHSVYAVTATTLNQTVTTSDGATYDIEVTYTTAAGIPMEGTALRVEEVLPSDAAYASYLDASASRLGTDTDHIELSRMFDIHIVDAQDASKVYEPAGSVDVSIRLVGSSLDQYANVSVLHFAGTDAAEAKTAQGEKNLPDEIHPVVSEETVKFTTGSFSVFVVAGYTLEKTIEASDGNTYRITVEYDENCGIPEGADLVVTEVAAEDYAAYLTSAAQALGEDVHSVSYGKLFDISIEKDGVTYQPNEDVRVKVELLDAAESHDIRVVHFDDADTPKSVAASVEGQAVTFETNGFSVFSFLDFSLLDHIVTAVLGEKTGTLYENDDIILSGSMPAYSIVEANQANVAIDGEEILVAYDIKIYSNSLMKALGLTWQPHDNTVSVTVKSDALVTAREGVNVYHFDSPDADPEMISEAVAVVDNAVTFDADSFSVYALTPETYHRTYRFFTLNENGQYVEYMLYTDNGTTTFTQIIKNGESLVVPQLPSIPGSSTSTFVGWYEGTGNVSSQPIAPSAITLSSSKFDFDNIPEITVDGEEVYLFARFAEYAYVIFHDQYNGSTGSFPVAMTRRGEKVSGTATVDIHDFSVAYDDDSDENSTPSMAFHGWSYTPITTPGAEQDDLGNTVAPITTDSIDITKNVDLYPIFQSIYWLSYYSGPTGSGATYFPSAYYYVGEGPETLSVPVRSGYTFDGWYTGSVAKETDDEGKIISETVTYGTKVANADGSLVNGATDVDYGISVSNGKLLLSENATIYAKWVESSVNYTVVIWRQKATDAVNLEDNKKTYDYAESFVLTGVTGQTVSVANTYKGFSGNEGYAGFHYNRCDDSKTVSSDGSTVLNVYYDRNVHTLTFNNASYTSYTSGTRYGFVSGLGYVELWRYGNRYYFTYNGNNYRYDDYGNGQYYSRVLTEVSRITGLYGSSIKDRFPIVGTDGTRYDGYYWEDVSGEVYQYILSTIETMPDADVTFITTGSGTAKTIYYYVEVGSAAESSRTFDGKYYTLYKTVLHNYRFITYDEEYHPITGYVRDYTHADPEFDPSINQAPIGYNNTNYLYYDRDEFQISFLDSYTNNYVYVGGTNTGNQLGDTAIKFKEPIRNYLPEDPTPVQIAGGTVNEREGYRFTGWFTDPACSTRVFFEDDDAYKSYTKSKVLYTTMPAYNLRFYAGWETIWYKIELNPNYGELNGSGSTWFWEPYNGDPIQEYSWATRHYVESASGTYFYHYDERAGHGWGDEWTSVEDEDQKRDAYYTTNQGEATDQSRTFKFAKNAYRYAGWYEVNQETGEETLYNFGEPVTHDTYLILHWKKIGTYRISYNAEVVQDGENIIGTVDGGDSNEELFVELDGDDYADNAEVVVSRTAKAPEGFNFIGWTIRGDSSETVYTPGQSFVFLAKYAVTMPEGETVFLDAVYSRVSTAKIIYDANGGIIDPAQLDYGEPTDPAAPEPVKESDAAKNTATIENLINNSEIRLSSGAGFSMDGAVLVGWSESPAYNPNTDTLFNLDTAYYVDSEEPVTLYAVWQVKVYFDKNNANATWGGDWSGYTWDEDRQQYSITLYVGNPVEEPTDIPVSSDPEERFAYWSEVRYTDSSDVATEYDFSSPVHGEMTLYGFWANAIQVPYHVVDSSNPEIISRDNEWRTNPGYFLVNTGTNISLTGHDDAYANAPEEYTYAFACVSNSPDQCSDADDKVVTSVSYNMAGKCVQVTYKNGTTADLQSGQEIYLVYYRDPLTLNIGYQLMKTDGELVVPTGLVSTRPTTASADDYNMQSNVSAPRAYASNNYAYYSYAIGTPGATRASQLHVITSSSRSDGNRPQMRVRNTWRGYQYSTDGGANWISCGYDGTIQLYVLYYETAYQPTIVTINEKTIGTTADMSEDFSYTVAITQTTTTEETVKQQQRHRSLFGGYYWEDDNTPATTTSSSNSAEIFNNEDSPYLLSNGESQSVSLFYSQINGGETYSNEWNSGGRWYRNRITTTITTTQTITVIQTPNTNFTTTYTSAFGSSTQPYEWTYTTDGNAETPSVTYINTHTPLNVEVHVAVAGENGFVLDDSLRDDTHSFNISLASERNFREELPPDELFTGDSSEYGFAGIVLGRGEDTQGSAISVLESNVAGIAYEQMYPGDANRSNIYELQIKDEQGVNLSQLGSYKIYYLYYPLPKVQYVKESSGGVLEQIVDNGDHPLNSGESITLNGVTVTQDQMLHIGSDIFTVTQNASGALGNNYFNMPLILDDTTVDPSLEHYLRYVKLGAGGAGATSTSELLGITDSLMMQLKVDENRVKWSLDGTTWNVFDGTPTIYAIYDEQGYDLRITKTVEGDAAGTANAFTVTLRSPAITKTTYSVTGTGYSTITATPATESEPGTITLTVHHGSDITISGLGRGTYTISEVNSQNYVLSAIVNEEDATVTHDQSIEMTLIRDSLVEMKNTRRTAIVTIRKTMVDTQNNSGTFAFTGVLMDGRVDITQSIDGLSAFTITAADSDAGTPDTYTGYIEFTLPVGTVLTVAEDMSTDQNELYTVSMESGTLTVDGETEENNLLAFINTRKPAQLTIRKIVSGGVGDQSSTNQFTFTLVSVADEQQGTTYSWVKGEESGTLTTANGHNTFTLAHGESILILLPLDKEIEIAEDNGIYTTTWTVSDQPGTTGSSAKVTLSSDSTLLVDNCLNPVSPTDYRINLTPYLLMLLAGSLLLLLRRKRPEQRGGGSVE